MQKGFITAKTEIKNKFISSKDTQSENESKNLDSEIPDLGDADLRPLAERLKESEKIKEEEFAEKVRLANTLRGLDQDELDFLDYMQQKKKEKDLKEKREIDKQVEEFKLQQKSIKPSVKPAVKVSVKPVSKSVSGPAVVMIKRKNQESDLKSQKKVVEYSDSD